MDINQAYDAQAAVIGSLLIEPKVVGEICTRLREEDFTDATLRNLFAAARAIWLTRKPLDVVTLLDRVGTAYAETIRDVMVQTPTAVNWEAYCKIVKDNAQLRALQDMAHRILACRQATEARQALLQAQSLLVPSPSMRTVHFKDMLQEFMTRLDDEKPADYLNWGFPQLNEQVQISAGRFVILAAESSVGKTALALQMAVGLARSGKRVGFFSLETSAPDATDRIMANTADVPLPAIKRKRLGPEAIRRCVDVANRDYTLELDLIEAAGATVEEMRAKTLQEQYDVIFIDYVQMIPAKAEDPTNQVRDVSIALHTMSQQLGVTIVGLSQVTPPQKDQKGRRPELSKDNLRESRQLIHDAEAILIMDLSDLSNYQSNRILKVDKNKDGPCCRMLLSFDARHMRFAYVPPLSESSERNEILDRNRAEKKAKAAAKEALRGAQEAAFEELEGGEEDLPF